MTSTSTSILVVATVVISLLYYLYSIFGKKIIARKHDNIPMGAHYSSWFGHTKYFTTHFDRVNDGVYDVLSVCKTRLCCMWSAGRQIVYILDPKLANWVFDEQFEAFEKGRSGAERYYELLGDGIFASDPGHGWKFQRKIASRMFSMRNLKNYMYQCCIHTTDTLMNKLEKLIQTPSSVSSSIVDINDMLGRMTLDCFTSIAFGKSFEVIELYPKRHPFSSSFDAVISQLGRRGHDPFWKLKKYFNVGNEALIKNNISVINSFADDILAAKKINKNKKLSGEYGTESYDLFSLFMKYNPSLTAQELKHISMNFIIAGRDTTRILLSWFLYLLDLHPSIKAKVVEEIESTTHVDYNEVCKHLKYIESCLLETMRLYPPVPFLARKAKRDICVPGPENYVIRKDDLLVIHVWSLSRLSSVYENALEFDPDRWMDKGLHTFHASVYPIFNINPRMCLGKQFALLEAKVFVYNFFKKFDYKVCENQVITYMPSAVLNMKNGMKIKLISK